MIKQLIQDLSIIAINGNHDDKTKKQTIQLTKEICELVELKDQQILILAEILEEMAGNNTLIARIKNTINPETTIEASMSSKILNKIKGLIK